MIESADEFVRLRCSDDPAEYGRAAQESADEAVWREVIQRFPEMRAWVAHNETVPLAILEVLSVDADPRVRSSVAMKRKLSRELFERLASDPDEGVRLTIIHNRKVPRDVLERLAGDPLVFVAETAQDRLRT